MNLPIKLATINHKSNLTVSRTMPFASGGGNPDRDRLARDYLYETLLDIEAANLSKLGRQEWIDRCVESLSWTTTSSSIDNSYERFMSYAAAQSFVTSFGQRTLYMSIHLNSRHKGVALRISVNSDHNVFFVVEWKDGYKIMLLGTGTDMGVLAMTMLREFSPTFGNEDKENAKVLSFY